MARRYEVTDEQWRIIEPHLGNKAKRMGRPQADNRKLFNGEVVTTLKQVANDDVADLSIHGTEKLIEGSITAKTLNVQEIFGDNATIRSLIAANIDVDTLFAREATLNAINAMDITSNTYLKLMVAEKADQSEVDALGERMDAAELKITPDAIVSTVTGSQQYQDDLASVSVSGSGIEMIVGTQTASTASWTGVSAMSELKDGVQIAFWLPQSSGANVTLNLTLADGSTTGAIPCYFSAGTRLGTQYSAGNVIRLTYRENAKYYSSTIAKGWWADANYNTDTYDRIRHGTVKARAYEPTVTRVKTVTMIPPRLQAMPGMPTFTVRPKRVAAYARVSTNSEEQLTSYEAQVKHYTEHIKSKEHTDNWQFVDVYTDKGITGTSTKKREGFNRMIQDALAGKIDLIITKSVSRFARNTVDTLTTIRKLKEHGVEVYFEEQNIYTMDGKGEVLLTIMSSIAQEESRNISENVTWGMRKRFAEGKVTMAYKQFMGYRRGKNGIPEVVEAEAKIIRTIFRRFLEGATPAIIARELNLAGIPCPSRKSLLGEDEIEAAKARKKTARWSPSTIESILTNEKYKGDAILQKTYCTDYIKKTFVVNDGSEIPKYYAQNSHPAIVSAEVFDLTQMELEWRRSLKGSYSGKSCFASRIVCGDCGAFYGSKVWHSTDEYRRTIWRCNNKYEGEKKCSTPHVTQDELEKAFVSVMQKIIAEKDAIFAVCHEVLDEVLDTSELDRIATRLQDQALGMAERVRKLVEENARVRRDQEEYQREYDALAAEHEKLSEKIRSIEDQKKDKTDRRRRIEVFLCMLEEQKECIGFDPYTFVALVDRVVVGQDRKLEIIFRNGMNYTIFPR